MQDGATESTESMDADAMLGSLSGELAALIAAGDLDADEASEMLQWLGVPQN